MHLQAVAADTLSFIESLGMVKLDVSSETILKVLKPCDFVFDVVTHRVQIKKEVWELLASPLSSPLTSKGRAASAGSSSRSSSSSSLSSSAAAAAVAMPGSTKSKRSRTAQQITSADLKSSSVDHGYLWEEFDIGDAVIVFFENFPIGGTIEGKSRRAQTFTVRLDTTMRDAPVTVSHRILEPLDSLLEACDDL